ncbi:hypothetical protein [Aeoliella mucimassa]|nr:hypothetical protein [Aeoliella mucimassa]
MSVSLALAVGLLAFVGCSKSPDTPTPPTTGPVAQTQSKPEGEHTHGAGPNGGVVFDLGSHHVEFTVDHDAQTCKFLILGPDEKTPLPVAASEFVVRIAETKTADGTIVEPMTIIVEPVDPVDGKAAEFIGTDPGIANVADFAGKVSGQVNGKPASGEFDESASGGHGHAHTPHDGMVAALLNEAGSTVGFVELKLHDDKGDLELWLAKDREITQPMDLPVDTEVQVTFADFGDKTVTLSVRNKEKNEDEDGTPNLRNGKTNYFIFPGDSGQDPSWLMGKQFKSAVTVSLSADGVNYTSEQFTLVPHTHADGEGHSH